MSEHIYSKILEDKMAGPHIEQLLQIDACYYDEKTRADFTKLWNWWKSNPLIYTLIRGVKDNQVAGYINAMPLSPSKFTELKTGLVMDISIKPQEIITPTAPGRYKLYIVSIAIRSHLKNGMALKALSELFTEKMISYAKQGIFFDEILMDAFTPEGVKLSKFFGASKLKDTLHSSQLYMMKVTDPSFPIRHPIFKQLQDLYKEAGVI
jgi:hypothetical protein